PRMRRRMDAEKQEVLERQGYRIVGEHSGVKLCHWTKASLTKGLGCYKQTFYGIESHRCLQMTPTVDACNLACQFCWRTQEWGSAATLCDRRGSERGDLSEIGRPQIRPRVGETEGDARPPADLADPDGHPTHAGRGMESRVGGRVRRTGPPRETDVHRVQGL